MPVVYTVDMSVVTINRFGNGLKFSGAQSAIKNPAPTNVRLQPTDPFSWSLIFHLSSLSGGQMALVGWLNTASVGCNLLINPAAGTVLFMFGSAGTVFRNYITLNAAFRVGINTITFTKTASLLTSGMNVFLNGSMLGGKVSNQANLQNIVLDYEAPSSALQFGKYNNTNPLAGIIYDATLNSEVITVADHISYMNSDGAKVKTASLIDKWQFNEKSGLTTISLKGNSMSLSGFASTSLGATNAWVDNYQQPILV